MQPKLTLKKYNFTCPTATIQEPYSYDTETIQLRKPPFLVKLQKTRLKSGVFALPYRHFLIANLWQIIHFITPYNAYVIRTEPPM